MHAKTTYNECAILMDAARQSREIELEPKRRAAGLRFAFKECDMKCRCLLEEENESNDMKMY